MTILIVLCHPPLHDGLHNSTPSLLLNGKFVFLIIAFTINFELDPIALSELWTRFHNFFCSTKAPEKAMPVPGEVMIFV